MAKCKKELSDFLVQVEALDECRYFNDIQPVCSEDTRPPLTIIREQFIQQKDPWFAVESVWKWLDKVRTKLPKDGSVQQQQALDKLTSTFEEMSESAMKRLGFCCGLQRLVAPLKACSGCSFEIKEGATFYYLERRDRSLCVRCYEELDMKGWEKRTLTADYPEEKVGCKKCGLTFHKVCVSYIEKVWQSQRKTPFWQSQSKTLFKCEQCRKAGNGKSRVLFKSKSREIQQISAKNLPSCVLSTKLESRVKKYLAENDASEVEVTIKVFSSLDRTQVQPQFKKLYGDRTPDTFPYCAKSIYAFTRVEEQEVCIFGMNTQEYGSDCPAPNRGTIYIAYLDSAQFFEPTGLRGKVYKQILMGYLKHASELGFKKACIWSCVPAGQLEYFFYRRPSIQKALPQEQLNVWYKGMLDKCKEEKIITGFDLLYKLPNNRLTDMPYYEGDIFPQLMEILIKEVQREKLHGSFSSRLKSKISNSPITGQFWITLGQGSSTIRDPDNLLVCDVARTRCNIIKFFKSPTPLPYQFSDLRQAAYATKALVFQMAEDCKNNRT